MRSDIQQLLDSIESALATLSDIPVDLGDADDVEKVLRRVNREVWRQIESVAAMNPVPISDVLAEVSELGVLTLIEAGVLRVDRKGWAKWKRR